jgi:hypothetical protein
MKTFYLVLTIVGFTIPAVFVPIYALEHPDNLLFIANPAKTLDLMFGNAGRSAFSADLLWVFIVFFVWLTIEARARGIHHSWIFILLTCLFGMSGPFPLFRCVREKMIHEPRGLAAAQQRDAAGGAERRSSSPSG